MIQAGAQVGISLVMGSRRLQRERLQLQPQLTKRLGSWDARSAAPRDPEYRTGFLDWTT